MGAHPLIEMCHNVHATGPRQELPSITCEGKPLAHLNTPVVNWYAPAGAGLSVVALNLPRVSLADERRSAQNLQISSRWWRGRWGPCRCRRCAQAASIRSSRCGTPDVLVLGARCLVPGPSKVLGPWCASTQFLECAESQRDEDEGPRTKDQGRTKYQVPSTKY